MALDGFHLLAGFWFLGGLTAIVLAWLVYLLASVFAAAFGLRHMAWLGFTTYNALFDVRSASNLLAVQIPGFVLAYGADRIADRAMPKVQNTEEYRLVRKRDVYLAALEGALVDGVVRDKERDMLVRLQDHLGLLATEARALELGMPDLGRES